MAYIGRCLGIGWDVLIDLKCIWPSTTNVGIGMVQDRDGGWFVVGRYWPQGNWGGKDAYSG